MQVQAPQRRERGRVSNPTVPPAIPMARVAGRVLIDSIAAR